MEKSCKLGMLGLPLQWISAEACFSRDLSAHQPGACGSTAQFVVFRQAERVWPVLVKAQLWTGHCMFPHQVDIMVIIAGVEKNPNTVRLQTCFLFSLLFSSACIYNKQLHMSFSRQSHCSKGKQLFSKVGTKASQNYYLRGERSCKQLFLTTKNYLLSHRPVVYLSWLIFGAQHV